MISRRGYRKFRKHPRRKNVPITAWFGSYPVFSNEIRKITTSSNIRFRGSLILASEVYLMNTGRKSNFSNSGVRLRLRNCDEIMDDIYRLAHVANAKVFKNENVNEERFTIIKMHEEWDLMEKLKDSGK